MTQEQTATPDQVRDVIRAAWAKAQRRSARKLSQPPPAEPGLDVPLVKSERRRPPKAARKQHRRNSYDD